MSREPNTPIGTCPCPTKACELVAPVYMYRQRNKDQPGRSRHAGKLYVVCPDHGRLDPQEFILANAAIDRTKEGAAPVETKEAPAPAAPVKPAAAAPSIEKPPAAKPAAKEGFGFYDN